MQRAWMLIEGPPAGAKHCEGCELYEATCRDGDRCPSFGDAYREPYGEGEEAGLLCRPPECITSEAFVERMMGPRLTEVK